MTNTLIDNSERFNMVHVLREHISDPQCMELRIASGYWDLPGTKLVYNELKAFFERGGRMKLLIGQEPQLRSYQLQAMPAVEEKFPDFYLQRDVNLLGEEYMSVARLLLDYCDFNDEENSPIQIRVYGQKGEEKRFLHAKCYIFLGQGYAKGIIGSSNFTEKGLSEKGNAELNYYESNNTIVAADLNEWSESKSHRVWFDEKWNDESCELWTGKFLEILTSAPIGVKAKEEKQREEQKPEIEDAPLTPYELYIKLLQYNFGDIVDANTTRKVESYLPSFYNAYQFQTDAVTQCYNIMQRYDGFMLADVVGLGKTVVGTMLIKHFLSVPDINDRPRRVLIVTPPAIRKGWEDTIKDFDKEREDKVAPFVDLITTGSIGSLLENEEDDDLNDTGDFETAIPNEEYGLVLIDESHKFRNNTTTMYKKLDALIGNSTIQPYVGLLSATPQNNRPDDIRNQIYLFSRTHTASKFEGAARNLEGFFAGLKQRYKDLKDMEPEERKTELNAISRDLRDNVLDKILVRRTRTDVRGYKDAEGNPVLKFPKVAPPQRMVPVYSEELKRLFNETMNAIMFEEGTDNGLGYYRYRAIQYLNSAEKKDRYRGKGSLDTDRVANQLANIMKLLLVKRLESSLYAFRKSLKKLYDDTCIMLDMLDKQTVFICPADQIDVAREFADTTKTWEERANIIRQKIAALTEKGKNPKGSNAEYTADDFTPEFKEMLIHDRDILKRLCSQWEGVKDPKHKVFRKQLRQLLPETESDKKLVIFTESADTLEDIKQLVEEEDFKPLCITAENRNKKQREIQENFDANYGKKEGEVQKNDYQIIISTDVLAEGINLHRAYTIINYDTPWNSTKLMQRIGRVNRIGSVADEVEVYNFLPSDPGDSIIILFNRAYTKLQSFHSTFGEDAQVYTDAEEVNHYDVVQHDLEEQESPLMKYLFELRDYKQAHPKRYEAIAAKEGCMEMAVDTNLGESLFLVRNARTQGLYVRLEGDEDSILSKEDMFDKIANIKDCSTTDLPADADEQKEVACYVFEAEFNRIHLQRNKKVKDEAIDILHQITTTYQNLSSDAMAVLRNARKLVDNGNTDVCNKIRAIGKHLDITAPSFGSMMIDAVETYLKKELDNVSQKLHQDSGDTEILIALYK